MGAFIFILLLLRVMQSVGELLVRGANVTQEYYKGKHVSSNLYFSRLFSFAFFFILAG